MVLIDSLNMVVIFSTLYTVEGRQRKNVFVPGFNNLNFTQKTYQNQIVMHILQIHHSIFFPSYHKICDFLIVSKLDRQYN